MAVVEVVVVACKELGKLVVGVVVVAWLGMAWRKVVVVVGVVEVEVVRKVVLHMVEVAYKELGIG